MAGVCGVSVATFGAGLGWRVSPDASTCTTSQRVHGPVRLIRNSEKVSPAPRPQCSGAATSNVRTGSLQALVSRSGVNSANGMTNEVGSLSCLTAFRRVESRRGSLIIARVDDFDGDEDDLDSEGGGGDEEDAMDDEMEFEIERDIDMPPGSFSVKDLDGLEREGGGEEKKETEVELVDYKIEEEDFHKLKLFECDFFIRKVPDVDDDLFDFREIYLSKPESEVYSRPKILGSLPEVPWRCTDSPYVVLVTKEMPYSSAPRAVPYQKADEVQKVFMFKHLDNKRRGEGEGPVDFENIIVLDAMDKSVRKAEVKVDVPGGEDRDRTLEILTVRDNGTSFRVIPKEERRSPDEIIDEVLNNQTQEQLETYLRGFRDFEKSNWF